MVAEPGIYQDRRIEDGRLMQTTTHQQDSIEDFHKAIADRSAMILEQSQTLGLIRAIHQALATTREFLDEQATEDLPIKERINRIATCGIAELEAIRLAIEAAQK
jgi:hypothetical protein